MIMNQIISVFHRIYDHQNGPHEWSDYMHQSKRSHIMMNTSAANGHLFTNYPSLFDYSTAPAAHLEPFVNILEKVRLFNLLKNVQSISI